MNVFLVSMQTQWNEHPNEFSAMNMWILPSPGSLRISPHDIQLEWTHNESEWALEWGGIWPSTTGSQDERKIQWLNFIEEQILVAAQCVFEFHKLIWRITRSLSDRQKRKSAAKPSLNFAPHTFSQNRNLRECWPITTNPTAPGHHPKCKDLDSIFIISTCEHHIPTVNYTTHASLRCPRAIPAWQDPSWSRTLPRRSKHHTKVFY